MIYSALYFPGSLARGDLIVRDNRYYPGKYSETFPVWWSYLRKNYPDESVVLFCDTASPIPIRPLLDALPEPWEDVDNIFLTRGNEIDLSTHDKPRLSTKLLTPIPRVHIKWLSEHSGKYFWPMQRNLVEAISLAYLLNDDLFFLDNDAFLNTNILEPIHAARADVAAPQIAHHQMTMDSVCTYISKERLHAMDPVCHLPTVLREILANGPTDLRMHTFQEGGLYKLFAYGRTLELGGQIELSHLSCYDNFLSFLKRNPLDTPSWRDLVAQLEAVDWSKMPGVERSFHDMNYSISS